MYKDEKGIESRVLRQSSTKHIQDKIMSKRRKRKKKESKSPESNFPVNISVHRATKLTDEMDVPFPYRRRL